MIENDAGNKKNHTKHLFLLRLIFKRYISKLKMLVLKLPQAGDEAVITYSQQTGNLFGSFKTHDGKSYALGSVSTISIQ